MRHPRVDVSCFSTLTPYKAYIYVEPGNDDICMCSCWGPRQRSKRLIWTRRSSDLFFLCFVFLLSVSVYMCEPTHRPAWLLPKSFYFMNRTSLHIHEQICEDVFLTPHHRMRCALSLALHHCHQWQILYRNLEQRRGHRGHRGHGDKAWKWCQKK